VSFDFFDRRSAERFAELLDETNGGRRHHAHSQADDQLAELVAIGHSLSAARPGVQVDPEFRVGLRTMLVATAERDGIGRTAGAADPDAGGNAAVRAGRSLFGSGAGRRIRTRGAIVVGVAAGAMAVSGISAASENAAPGDALYGVKRSTERAQLAMAGSDLTRGQLSLDFARNRLAEAAALPGDNPKFRDVLADMDTDTTQGVRLLTGAAVAQRSRTPLSTVDTFVATQRRAITPLLTKLGTDNRERAVTSMNLLDDVHQRADDLRAGLACDTVTPDGTDVLGPRLRECSTGSGSSSPPEPQQGTGEKQSKPGSRSHKTGTAKPHPTRSGTAGDPAQPQDQATTPADDATTAATDPATPDQSTPPADPGDDDTGPIDKLLHGILGH
jgi:Domain of unknown function (DUF5667)